MRSNISLQATPKDGAPEFQRWASQTMADLLESSKYSVSHARKHIAALKEELQAFHAAGPFREVVEFDPTGPTDVHKLKLEKELPDALPGIAFDAVSSLRAALDQAGYSIAIAAGASGNSAYFPFGDTKIEVESRSTGASREIPPSIFQLMLDAKPYRDGDPFLWALNKLCNYHKHRYITPVAIYTGGAKLKNAYFSSVRSFSFPPRWDLEKQEMILAEVPHRAPFTMNMQIQTFVSFAGVEGLPPAPCEIALEKIAHAIEHLLEVVAIQCRALGLQQ